jgi:hypothetical protein
MKKNGGLRRGWLLFIGGGCFLAGSLAVGSFATASALAPGTTVNQGAAGTSPWPVSGNVGIDPAQNHVHVDNLPTTQSVNGTVQTATTTNIIHTTGDILLQPSAESATLMDQTDTTPYKEVTAYVPIHGQDNATEVLCSFVTTIPGGGSVTVASVDKVVGLPFGQLVETLDPAPPNLSITCTNLGDLTTVQLMLTGRSN